MKRYIYNGGLVEDKAGDLVKYSDFLKLEIPKIDDVGKHVIDQHSNLKRADLDTVRETIEIVYNLIVSKIEEW
jgi:hypothetical protein